MHVETIDPWDITVSEFNERRQDLNLGPLAGSIERQGVVQPPLVRPTDASEYEYEVFVGQRRVLAAQGTVDTIPVVVMDAPDTDALIKSITENVDAFREDVSREDRAKATMKVLKETGWSQHRLGEELDVGQQTISKWIEQDRDEWEGTLIDPDFEPTDVNAHRKKEQIRGLPQEAFKKIRQRVGGGQRGEEIALKVADEGLAENQMNEVSRRVQRGQDIESAIREVARSKSSEKEAQKRVRVNMSFSDDIAHALRQMAIDRATSEEQIVRDAVEEYLWQEGWL